uniref:Amiloride-sensitive cation channel 1, neuronal n=1 Tax=Canis lupus dingo TaxID=286419 RepID=A0A8C0KNZ7_CANLU
MDLKESPSEGSLQPSSIHIFANTSTLHGIRHIFVYGPMTIRRVLWAVAFVGSLGLLLVESSERVSYYLSYQHVTKVDEVVAQSLVFPAVTLCNLNGFRFSRLTTNDLYHAGELLALLDVNLQIPDPHLKANFKHYKPKQFSMLEFLHRVGHDLKDMLLYCKFKGQECGHQDFTTVSTWLSAYSRARGIRHCILWAGLELKLPEKGVWGPRQPGWFQWLGKLVGAGDAAQGVEVSVLPFLVWIPSSVWGEETPGDPGSPSGLLAGQKQRDVQGAWAQEERVSGGPCVGGWSVRCL